MYSQTKRAQTLVVYLALWAAWLVLLFVPTRYLVLAAGLYEFTFRLLPVQVRHRTVDGSLAVDRSVRLDPPTAPSVRPRDLL